MTRYARIVCTEDRSTIKFFEYEYVGDTFDYGGRNYQVLVRRICNGKLSLTLDVLGIAKNRSW
jgi:hypothetical protein